MSNGKILIVEDEGIVVADLQAMIKRLGYTVVGTAASGEDAVKQAERLRPDLILMDIQLPQVSGLEVTRWIKDDPELRAIPVVAVTAFAMKGDEERIREGGCEAYLSKPISVGKFIETVRRFIG
jgi:two-component system cell cycle response regulator DivK